MTPEQATLRHVNEDGHALSLEEGVALLKKFPYQDRPYAARNWGHPLHSLCSYPSKIKPGLAHFLIKAFTTRGDVLLDPFSGVGTIPFEAASQGRVALATDLSPFASLVSAAKLDPPSSDELHAELVALERRLPSVAARVDLDHIEPEIRSFFHDDTCRDVVASQKLLLRSGNESNRAARLMVAATAHILHGNRPYALSRRSHGIIPIPPKGEFVYKSLIASLRAKIGRLSLDLLPSGFVPGSASQADAFHLPFEDGSVDVIITSPPFLGTTEFLRQNRVRLWYCGMSYARQLKERDQFIEHRKGLGHYRPLLLEWARVLRGGGCLVMHTGVVKNRDMAEEIRPHAEEAGFDIRDLVYEPASHLESHGRTDRGATHTHQFLIAQLS